MFNGTIPTEMRSIVSEYARHWPTGSDLYIGCSGNLTIERALASHGFRLHSNDITAYSCALGWYFAGQPVPYRVKESSREWLDWLDPYLDDGAGTVATLMIGTRFLQFVGNPGAYHRRMVAAHREQWQTMWDKTRAKVEAVDLPLAEYFAGDVRDYLAAAPPEAPVVMFPPFYGSSDYENMFKPLDTHFDWPTPEYRDLDEPGKDEIIATVVDRPHWLLGLHVERPDLADHLRGVVQTTNRGIPIYVYSGDGPVRVVQPRQPIEPVLMPKIGQDDELDGPLRLHVLTAGQFSALRSQFMSKTIKPGSPLLAVAVSAGGKLIGAYAMSHNNFDPNGVYLLSDFPVSWSRYKRLSKLIVMAALSDEARLLAQRSMPRALTHLSTTAFTNRPNSAKYGRGIPNFKLLKRTEPGGDGIHDYQLQYGGPLGQWTLAEGLELWRDKHEAAA